ncbi:hypothetical protein [Ruminococcus sp. FMB-CY1]|uniref:hypothetical protein n=1 Tax=Ruminococcus sp. FMB-CY1 TaxID=2878202 RepID=UPI00208EE5BB|nr:MULTISPECIES: hypothetical protein [unclassified Ruminococcus]
MFKKALSLVVSLMLMVTSLSFAAISVSAADTTYVVAGAEELCGVLWKGSPEEAPANVMTDNGDGTYTKVFTNVQPASGLTLKVVENGADGSQNWIGDATGNNITFNVTAASDVTVKFDSSTKEITVTGDGVQFVTNLDIKSINAVGNGDPEDAAWLNGVAWDPAANPMTEVSEKVYEITFKNVSKFDNYQVKFAANGGWTDSWGGAAENFTPESGVEFDAAYNGENLTVNVPYEFADVTLKLDLTNFDYATKAGAKATVTVTEVSTPAETTEVATTEATTAPATQATAAPEKAPLTVNATSNVFSTAKAEYNSKTNQVTVCYYLGTNCDLVNLEWYFTYDSNIFEVNNKNNLDSTGKKLGIMPQITSSSVINTSIPGKVNANSSDLGLYTIDAKVPFIKIVLDVKGNPENVETNVNLNVRVLTKGEMDFNTMRVDPDTMVSFVLEYKIVDPSYIVSAETKLTESTFVPSTESTEAPETTVPETTVPETTVPETTVPETTVPETTEEVPAGALTVNATSNLFPASSNVVAGDEEYVTVTYYFESEKNVLNADFNLTYDPTMLALDSVMTPYTNGVVVNSATAGKVYGNMSSLELYNFNQKTPFVSVVFKKLGLGETDVNLTVDNLTLSLANAEGVTDEAQEEGLVRDGVLAETSTKYSVETEIQAGKVTPVVPTTAEPTTAPAPAGSTYVVAGSEELCGVLWKGSPEEAPENVMTDNGDGTYTKVFTNVQIADSLQIKVVENTADGGQNWIGDNGGDNNITFNVLAACDVTVTYDSNTRKITVSGDGVQIVSDIEIKSMHAVGNGDPDDESWLNGVAWDPTANEMEQVADKVYEITYHNVPEFDNYQVKFAANGKWADSWGSAEEGFTPESGVAFDAVYNGQNLTVNVPYEFADVTLRIDLSNFNYATKLGAVATVTVTEASQAPSTAPETTVPATTVPETTVPATTVPETTVPATTVPATTVPATTIAQNTTTPNTTLAPATEDATSSTGATVKPGTADTANNGNNGNSTANNNNGTVKTGNASMAAVILLVLVSATGVVYFTRKKVK